jgi:hypothetical protein
MNTRVAARLESLSADGVGLEAEFCWQEDRFQHTVYLRDGRVRRPLLSTPADRSEHAVALVELHPQLDTSPQPTLFLHGAGGGAQWSMSVALGGEGELRFDVAARVLQPPLERTIRYQEAPGASGYLIAMGPDTELRVSAPGELELLSRAGGPACPTTLRWQYSFRLELG